DDVAGLGGARPQPLDHLGIAAGRHEADVLAVVLVGNRQAKAAGEVPGLRLAALAKREAENVELLAGGGEQEVALVALGIARAVERASALRQLARGHVMAGGQNPGAKLARRLQEVAEFDRLVALDTRHRGLS